MQAVLEFAAQGGPVLGICNGFQILCEAGLLPGALIRNRSLQFRCEHVFLKTAHAAVALHQQDSRRKKFSACPSPTARAATSPTRRRWTNCKTRAGFSGSTRMKKGDLTARSNPNGSLRNIAGICNQARNVAGLMPHPERASETILGSADGRLVFESLAAWLESRLAQAA